MLIKFRLSGLNIEYTKRDDVESRVNELKSQSVDPFNGKLSFLFFSYIDFINLFLSWVRI